MICHPINKHLTVGGSVWSANLIFLVFAWSSHCFVGLINSLYQRLTDEISIFNKYSLALLNRIVFTKKPYKWILSNKTSHNLRLSLLFLRQTSITQHAPFPRVSGTQPIKVMWHAPPKTIAVNFNPLAPSERVHLSIRRALILTQWPGFLRTVT